MAVALKMLVSITSLSAVYTAYIHKLAGSKRWALLRGRIMASECASVCPLHVRDVNKVKVTSTNIMFLDSQATSATAAHCHHRV